jgi:uncharacterized membrane protein
MNPLDFICQLAAADPHWALSITGMLIGVILGVLWAWSDEGRDAS